MFYFWIFIALPLHNLQSLENVCFKLETQALYLNTNSWIAQNLSPIQYINLLYMYVIEFRRHYFCLQQ